MPYADPEAKRAHGRRYYQQNRETIIAKVAAWRLTNPEKTAETKAAWSKANQHKMKAYGREWYLANKELAIERGRAHYQRRLEENPELVRANNREIAARRRARIRGLFVEVVDPQRVWERDGGLCGICGIAADEGNWHMDHIVPIARGGPHSYANVQVAHPKCNQRKAAS